MCGIAGTYGTDWDVSSALDRIAHRGPDGRGMAEEGDARLGHVRLAIRDPLPRSDQPFVYGPVTLTYVGEIWNQDRLRDALEGEGYAFRTEGDTEVVAAALRHWGPDALRKLDGMFALAWSDEERGTYLARDRYGKVPLYFRRASLGGLLGAEVSWASERKAWPVDGWAAEPVPPGSVLRLDQWDAGSFYSLPDRPARPGPPDPKEVLGALRTAVRRRLQADVPVCCLISGGLDSSLILALTKELKPDVVAYAAVFDDGSPDLEAARYLAERLDVELREVRVQALGEAQLRESVRAIEVTSKTQVEIGTLCLPLAARIRADGFRVALSGEGADEIFGGYGTLARRATDDLRWRRERAAFLEKMGRSDLMRVNKSFMAHGVEPRTPFLDRDLVEMVLAMGVKQCPPGKKLLVKAAQWVVPDKVRLRKKLTFQGAAGVADHFDRLLGGAQRKAYNALAREEFGGLPRG